MAPGSSGRASGASTTGGGRRLGPYLIGGAVVIVLAAVVLAVALSGGGGTAAEQESSTVTVGGEDLPAFPRESQGLLDPATDEAVGLTIPKITGEDFESSEVVIDPADGRPKVILFVAHWCPHCQNEVPQVQEWIDAGGLPDGVDLVTVSTAVDENRTNYPPSAWLDREGWTPEVLADDPGSTAGSAFGLSTFPYFVAVDAEGAVVQRGSGELTADQLDGLVSRLAG